MWAQSLSTKQQDDRAKSGEHGHWTQVAPADGDSADAPLPITWEPVPTPSARLRASLSVPAVVGVVVFVLALVCTAWFVLQGIRGDARAIESAPGFVAADPAAKSVGDADNSGGSMGGDSKGLLTHGDQPTNDVVFVHVVGEAMRPGVVELEAGARVADAIEAAGGATPAALLGEMNLARKVVDGERIVVPSTETLASLPEYQHGEPGVGIAGGPGGTSGLLNVNTATASAFETLPGIGPAIAARIVAWREANGQFASIDQLTEVSGIGARTLEGFRDLVTV